MIELNQNKLMCIQVNHILDKQHHHTNTDFMYNSVTVDFSFS